MSNQIPETVVIANQLYDLRKKFRRRNIRVTSFFSKSPKLYPHIKRYNRFAPLVWKDLTYRGNTIIFRFKPREKQFHRLEVLIMITFNRDESVYMSSQEDRTKSLCITFSNKRNLYFQKVSDQNINVFNNQKDFCNYLHQHHGPSWLILYHFPKIEVSNDTFVTTFARWQKEKPTYMVAEFLLDSSIFSGLGDYLVSEILNDINVHPKHPLESFNTESINKLYTSICNKVVQSYELDGVSKGLDQEIGEFSNNLNVYRKPNANLCVFRGDIRVYTYL